MGPVLHKGAGDVVVGHIGQVQPARPTLPHATWHTVSDLYSLSRESSGQDKADICSNKHQEEI
jgi:hypothetical protein